MFCETLQYASRHGDFFRVICPLWGESTNRSSVDLYGVSIVNILGKTDRVTTALHCMVFANDSHAPISHLNICSHYNNAWWSPDTTDLDFKQMFIVKTLIYIHFQNWLSIDWHHSRQPIRSHVYNLLRNYIGIYEKNTFGNSKFTFAICLKCWIWYGTSNHLITISIACVVPSTMHIELKV